MIKYVTVLIIVRKLIYFFKIKSNKSKRIGQSKHNLKTRKNHYRIDKQTLYKQVIAIQILLQYDIGILDIPSQTINLIIEFEY
jgi:hypothetical protein